ncbi:GNAT family N-acetyltransferase [Oceanobacillus manasiensis]|uniref:GNAT family N-acetyltransferase n=1 Tax=Oceanobacillus manasiensis TaxID=586413 RepID=UPI0005A5FEFD|nr:GNAT family N-acetyltransferase [Oceanobacillus manasiensis]
MNNNLHIRPYEKEDLEFMYKMRTNSDVMDYWFAEPYTTMEKLKKAYEELQESEANRQFILYHSDEKIGYVGLYGINLRHSFAKFAIMIDPEQQGNGYAEDATRLMVDYSFNQLNLHKLSLDVIKVNEKAIHIYEKVGFHVEGEQKKHYFVNGSYHDAYMMSLFQEDYVNQ